MCMCYHSLNSLTLCFGLTARDFNAVGYIAVTKKGNKTGKYLEVQVFTVQKGLGTSVPTRVRVCPAGLSHRDSLVTLGRPCHLTLDLALGSPHSGSRPLGQTPQCACHRVDGILGPSLILSLCQMTLIPHQLDLEGFTSTADPGSDCSPIAPCGSI